MDNVFKGLHRYLVAWKLIEKSYFLMCFNGLNLGSGQNVFWDSPVSNLVLLTENNALLFQKQSRIRHRYKLTIYISTLKLF